MRSFMTRLGVSAFAALLALLVFTKPATATTAVLLRDEQLIADSRVILLGKVRSVAAQMDHEHQTIYTYVKVAVTEVLKGELRNETIVFKQLGGRVNGITSVIFGAPEYQAGQRVLLFLNTANDGTLRIAHLFQGKYDVAKEEGVDEPRIRRDFDRTSLHLMGEQEGPDITNAAALPKFLKKIRKTLRRQAEVATASESAKADIPVVEIPGEYIDVADGEDQTDEVSPQYALFSARWRQPDLGQPVVFMVNPNNAPVPGGGNAEINLAMAAWSNVQTTALVIQNGGPTSAGGFRNQDGVTAIAFNDPLGEIQDPSGCAGILAIGGYSRAGSPIVTIGGLSFYSIIEGDVVFNNNFSCFLGIPTNLAEVACHEIGHAIGFNHSSDTNAIMYATAHGHGRGATLGSDDVAAVSFLYPGSKSGVTAPAAPSNLSATTASSSVINLSWSDNSNNESEFRLERKIGAGGTYSQIATLPAGQTTYSNTGLSASTTYYYRVRAANAGGTSAYSNEANATTSSSQPPPGGGGADTIGLYTSSGGGFFLRNANSGGVANITFTYGGGGAGLAPLAGDWNGDGVDTIGLYSPTQGAFFLRNANSSGVANISFSYGPAGLGWVPLVGDWDGNGTDTIGLYSPTQGAFFLRNANSGGVADVSFSYGPAGLGWIPVVGDWDGNGTDTIGLYSPTQGAFFLRNANSSGVANISFSYGPAGLGWVPLVGDWDGNGTDTIGLYSPTQGAFFLRNANSSGVADVSFSYGPSGLGWVPIIGNWDGL